MVLDNISKEYEGKIIFKNFSYKFDDGQITAILGESGVGKTTLLNIIAGLTDYEGKVDVQEISMMFQEDRLIPNLTVENNLKVTIPNIDIDLALDSVQLKDCKDKFPAELSAGMSRRVAFARALNYNKPVLLMDEPFGHLDYATKYHLMDILKSDHKKHKNTIVVVTHDIDEAMYLADRIVLLGNNGVIKNIKKIGKKTRDQILKFLITNKQAL